MRESGGVGGGVAEFGRFQEEARRGKVVGREALVEESGAEGAVLGRVFLHQCFKLGGQVGHAEAKLFGELAVSDGLTRRCKGGEAGFKRAFQGRRRCVPGRAFAG